MKVEEWFNGFVKRLIDRTACREGWPPRDSQFWLDLRRDFVEAGVSEPVADEAAFRLRREDFFPNQVPGKLLAYAAEAHADANAKRAGLAAGSLEEAQARSRDCPECSGSGITSRRFRMLDRPWPPDVCRRRGEPEGTPRTTTLAFRCLCPLGMFQYRLDVESAREAARRAGRDPGRVRVMPPLAAYDHLRNPGLDHPAWVEPIRRSAFFDSMTLQSGAAIELEHAPTWEDEPAFPPFRTVREMLDGLKLSPRRGEPVY